MGLFGRQKVSRTEVVERLARMVVDAALSSPKASAPDTDALSGQSENASEKELLASIEFDNADHQRELLLLHLAALQMPMFAALGLEEGASLGVALRRAVAYRFLAGPDWEGDVDSVSIQEFEELAARRLREYTEAAARHAQGLPLPMGVHFAGCLGIEDAAVMAYAQGVYMKVEASVTPYFSTLAKYKLVD